MSQTPTTRPDCHKCGDPLTCATCGAHAQAPMNTGWQPIETAPKDGTQFIGWMPINKRIGIMHWNSERFHKNPVGFFDAYAWLWGIKTLKADQPTHWMPLPAPPVPTKAVD